MLENPIIKSRSWIIIIRRVLFVVCFRSAFGFCLLPLNNCTLLLISSFFFTFFLFCLFRISVTICFCTAPCFAAPSFSFQLALHQPHSPTCPPSRFSTCLAFPAHTEEKQKQKQKLGLATNKSNKQTRLHHIPLETYFIRVLGHTN